MHQNYPHLSIVLNNYNYGAYLGEALNSVLRQLSEDDELIAVDDGSTDDSSSILKDCEQQHGIRLIEQKNQGQMRAVRRGIEAARGDIIVLLDSDDCFLDGYLARLRKIYRENHDVSFVFTDPEVIGGVRARETRKILDHMEFPPGRTGPTRWATQLFHEYVGVPTSGIALRKSLADAIISLPESMDETTRIGTLQRLFFGISTHEANNFGYAADDIIVRCASVLGAEKYYNDQRGMRYRIHDSNKYAALPGRGQWYIRRRHKRSVAKLISAHFSLERRPTTEQLYGEFSARSLPERPRRRLRICLNYCLAMITSRGSLKQKLIALMAVSGYLLKVRRGGQA